MFETVRYEEREDRIATILLDRPESRNAFNRQLYGEVAEALRIAAESKSVRVAVLGTTSDNFSAGADIKEWAAGVAGSPGADPTGFLGLVDALSGFPKPLVAGVEGYAIGIAATALLHCDFVVMAEDARIRMPFATLSIAPEAGSSVLLPRAVGPALAREMLLLGSWVDAKRLYEAGWVYAIAPRGGALDEAMDLGKRIASYPSSVSRRIKSLIVEAERQAVAEARAREDAANAEAFASPEFREAVAAFLQKRDPDYSSFE